jgi:ribonuclease P protein component
VPQNLPDQRLPRALRVLKRPEFEHVYTTGARRHAGLMTIFMAHTSHSVGRLGVAATKKLGSAVVRNRAKRLAREVFRRHKVGAGIDVVIVPKREMLDADSARIEADFVALLQRSRANRPHQAPDARPRREGAAPRAKGL